MAVQNRLAQAEDVPEEDAGLTQFDTHYKLCCLVVFFVTGFNHLLVSYDALFRCLSAGRVHAHSYRSRVLAQGSLVLSPTRY